MSRQDTAAGRYLEFLNLILQQRDPLAEFLLEFKHLVVGKLMIVTRDIVLDA